MRPRAAGLALLITLCVCLGAPPAEMEAQQSLLSSVNVARVGTAMPQWTADGVLSIAEIEAFETNAWGPAAVAGPAPSSGICGYDDGTAFYDAAGDSWARGAGSIVLKNGVHFANGYAVRLFIKDGVVYADNSEWGSGWYVAHSGGWAHASPQSCLPPSSGVCRYDDGTTLYDAAGDWWARGAGSIVLKNGVHFANGTADRLFIKEGVVYADNTGWGDRWYVSQPGGWSYASPQSCGSLPSPDPGVGSRYKIAYWNMQNGAGMEQWVSYGASCPFPGARYGTQSLDNAWNKGHLQMYLQSYVTGDPEVIALGATELNSGYSQGLSPAALGAYLGWPGHWFDGEAIYARHGFKDPPSRAIIALGACDGKTPMWALYAKVFRTAEAAAANSDDYVNVVSTHFRHVDASYACGAADSQGTIVREWLAAHANNGKPTIVVGDLNLIVEPALDPAIQNYVRNGEYWYSGSLFPDHMTAWNRVGFVDAYRTIYPDYATHPGFTSTWHGGPYYATPWKRIDYALVKGSTALDVQLFNHVPEGSNPKNCVASDHAGLVATMR